MVSTPVLRILSSVSWASAGVAASATARVRTRASTRVIKCLLVSEDLGQELPSPVGLWCGEERLGRGLFDHLPFVHEDDAMGDAAGAAPPAGDAHQRPPV